MANPTTYKNMKYVRLGNSGLKVSKVILGCMSYGNVAWFDWLLSEEEGIKHIKAAYDAGINTFDTADIYSNGESEKILGKAIKQLQLPRDEIVVITKIFGVVTREPSDWTVSVDVAQNADNIGYVNQHGLSRKHIFDGVNHSLERLGLDYIDVLLCHRFDYDTPIEETMHALHDIVKSGKVRYIGMSSCYAYQMQMMQYYALHNNLTPFIAMQNHHSLLYREEEREMMPALKHLGIGAIPYSPLARGLLTRPVGQSSKRAEGGDSTIQNLYNRDNEIIDRVEEVAKKRGISMAQVALAWALNRDDVTASVVGTRSLENLADLIGAVRVELTADEMAYLEERYKPQPVMI